MERCLRYHPLRVSSDETPLLREQRAHNLGKQVCAEGVENPGTLQRLTEMGCDLAQGYWISRPVSAGEFMQWLVDTSWGLRTPTPP